MLADPRADALVENFAGQWLHIRNLQNIAPNTDEFPDFDNDLREAFRRETELFFGSIVREDRSVLDLMTADYTFVNERLAKHYGMPNVYGSQFRRVTLDRAMPRRGLLGKGSILMATSHADRTAPTLRGKWILENLLGTPPPAPPANVPPFEQTAGRSRATMRERMEIAPRQPGVRELPPVDGPARVRARELRRRRRVAHARGRRTTSTPQGTLADGDARRSAWPGCAHALLAAPDVFVRDAHREADDLRAGPRPAVLRHAGRARDRARRGSARTTGSRRIIMGIVKSAPFQMRSEGGRR